MNSTRDISLEIYKSIFWVWLHLGSVTLVNVLGYISFLEVGISKNVSFSFAFIGATICTIVPTIYHPSPTQARYRLYWAIKFYSVYSLVMVFLNIQNTSLLVVWLGVLVVDVCLILFVVFYKRGKLRVADLKKNRSQQNPFSSNASNYQKVAFDFTQTKTSSYQFGSILSDEMYKRNWSVGYVAQLTGVEEERILRLTKGEEKPTQEEVQTLFGYFGIDPSRLKNLIDSGEPS